MDVFFYAQKLHCFRSRYQKATIRVRVSSYFFHKLLFGDIKLSDLESRNRKLSAHDCTDHSYQYTKYITYLPNNMAAWKRSTRIYRSCCGGIITGRFVSLVIKKYQQDKKQDTCWQIAARFQFLINFSER